MTNNNSFINKILYKVHLYFKRHYLVRTFITFLPTIWMSLLIAFLGVDIGLVQIDQQTNIKSFTVAGWISTVVLFIIVLAILLSGNYISSIESKAEIEELRYGYDLLDFLMACIGDICKNKYDTLKQIIADVTFKNGIPPHIISAPTSQLSKILAEITHCFIRLQDGLRQKNIDATIAYRINKKDAKWVWVENSDTDRGLTLDELMSSVTSTFYCCYTSKAFIFYNDKKEAFEKHEYVYDKTDDINRLGSIMCKYIKISINGTIIIESILSVSSYNNKFVQSDDQNRIDTFKQNVVNLIMPEFEKRIRIELALLYLSKMYDELNASNP